MVKLNNQTSIPNIAGAAYKPKNVMRSRNALSGIDGTIPINVSGIKLIHTTTDYAFDEIFLWAACHDSSTDRELSISIVSSSTPAAEAFSADHVSNTFLLMISNKEGLQQFYPGVPHKNVSVYATASVDHKINIIGYIDRHYRIDLTDIALGYDGGGE